MRTLLHRLPAASTLSLLLLAALAAGPAAAAEATPAQAQAQAEALLKKADDYKRLDEDVTQRIIIQETVRDVRIVREGMVYNRANNDMSTLFTAPKTVEGTGYLRLGRNLFSYEPSIGKWDRRTDRDQLAGTNVRRSDLTTIPLAEEYNVSNGGDERLGKVTLHRLLLKAKPGVEVSFPTLKLWVDDDGRERKREEYAESGKLLRTSYVTKMVKVFSKAGNRWLYLPSEIRMLDAVEKDRQTVLATKAYEVGPIPSVRFTKAWLASKSR
jgi:hypothetical protein